MKMPAKLGVGALTGAAAVSLALATWYWRDRPQMLEALCDVGLPNLSRPASVSPESLGCVILSPHRRYTGVVETAFEHSFFISDDLPPNRGGRPGTAWFTCSQATGCDLRLEEQLAQPLPGACLVRLASVTVDGWVTETPGGYGHLNMAERELYVDRVISVGPPPTAEIKEHQEMWTRAGGGECS